MKKILIGECGHASRTAKVLLSDISAAAKTRCRLSTSWSTRTAPGKQGRLKLDPNAITEPVTYHDPCNIARPGWIVEQPRELLKAFCSNYVEMTPNRRNNICCGGGGGTVSIDEIRPVPHAGGRKGQGRADQGHRSEVLRRAVRQLQEAASGTGGGHTASTARLSACTTCCTRRSCS